MVGPADPALAGFFLHGRALFALASAGGADVPPPRKPMRRASCSRRVRMSPMPIPRYLRRRAGRSARRALGFGPEGPVSHQQRGKR